MDPDQTAVPDAEPTDPRLDDELAAGEGLLAGDLRALLAPGAGIGRRTADSVDRTLRSRSAGATALGLLGVGWETVRILLSDDGSRADRGGVAAERERRP